MRTRNPKKWLYNMICCSLLVGTMPIAALAGPMSNEQYTIVTDIFSSASNQSHSSQHKVDAIIGQPMTIGISSSSHYQIKAGFLFTLAKVENSAPVADAGPDQLITLLGTLAQLDGTQSFDNDGDPLTFAWSLNIKPAGSTATLDDPNIAMPEFTVDIHGEYKISLVVTDSSAQASLPDSIIVSFDNIQPVAAAGINQVISTGSQAFLDGSASSDLNDDTLTYQWSFIVAPVGSTALLIDSNTSHASFTADLSGNYLVSLVVNDNKINSDPDTITITAVDSQNQLITLLQKAIDKINQLVPTVFKNKRMANALTNKLNSTITLVDQGEYQEALDKLRNDLLKKCNGCAEADNPDKNDWIRDCTAQGVLYPILTEATALLQALI